MDELFRINSPAGKEIKLTDDEEDDPFNPKNEEKPQRQAKPVAANINIQPSVVVQKKDEEIPVKPVSQFDFVKLNLFWWLIL